ncbi:MAG TPA: ABC transporter substrate-binding protein [Casimicrobiaceae bacterium]|nr:ABC transporter substrate-binding protein [Casimicrobiaceae bacterium]
MIKRQWRTALVAAIAVMSSFVTIGFAQAADDVSIQLDWLVRGDHAMFFVARDNGYFKEQGINITVIRKGTGSTDALKLVANGNADFGFADLPTLLVGRSQHLPVVALVAVNQESPLAMISIKSKHPMSKPADMKGMNIGVHPSGSTYVFLKSFFAKNGLNLADFKQSTVAPPYENMLLLGRVDVVPGYIDAEVPELEAHAGGPGSLSILLGSDYGYDAYGSGVFTAEKTIAEKPDLVQRFVNAYMKAFAFTIENPQQAVDIVVKANPEYKGKEHTLMAQLQADVKSTFFSPYTKQHGIGAISEKQWNATVQVLKDQSVLPTDFNPVGGFNSTFVEKAKPLKR